MFDVKEYIEKKSMFSIITVSNNFESNNILFI